MRSKVDLIKLFSRDKFKIQNRAFSFLPSFRFKRVSTVRLVWKPAVNNFWIRPISLPCRVRVALSSGTGNGDLWDKPFQLEFSVVDHLSMSSRTRSEKVNKDGRKDSAERVFKLLLNVVNQIFCS